MAAAQSSYSYRVPLEGTDQSISGGQLTVNPMSHEFGTVVLGSAATVNTTVTNTGQEAVRISGFDVAAPYSATNSCPSTLVGGASCSVTVTYTPKAAGSHPASLTIRTEESDAQATFGLSGVAVVPTTNLTLSANTVDLGAADVGTPATNKLLTITNAGNSPATVTGIGVLGSTEFNQSNSCGGRLVPGGKCTISLAFVPNSYGARSGNLSVYEDASGTLYSVALTGFGNAAVMSVSPASLAFDSAIANYSSTTKQATVSNTGNKPITGLSLATTADDYTIASKTCTSTVEPGASCTVTVSFGPKAAGPRSGELTAHTLNAGTAEVALSGTGIAQAPAATVTPSSLAFEGTPVDGSSVAQQVTFKNTGNVIVSPGALSFSAGGTHYAVSSTCGPTLAVGATCTASVTFTPRAAGAQPGNLRANFSSGALNVALTGSGTLGVATVSPTSLTYADQQVATTSAAKAVTVTNTGNRKLTFSSVGIAVGGANFAQANDCATVAPGAKCTLTVTFTPSAAGSQTGTLSLTHDGVDGTTLVDLSGVGRVQTASLSTPSFAATPVNSNSTATATLSNTGIGPLAVTVPGAGSVAGAGYSFASTTCGVSVAVGSSCAVTVRFAPTSTASASGTLTLATGAGNQAVSFGSTGIQGYATISPSSLTFSPQQTNTTSAVQVVTVTNTGTDTLSFSGVGIAEGTGHFGQSNGCASVPVNGSCTASVTFTPTATGALTGKLAFTHNGGGIALVNLSGDGRAPAATLSTPAFPSTPVGSSSTANAALTNTGVGPLSVTVPAGGSVTGAGYSFVSSTCPSTLAAGATCLTTVRFAPTSTTPATGSLSINTLAGVHSVSFGSTGIQGYATISPSSLSFAPQQTGTTSASQVVTVTNTGTNVLTFSGVGVGTGTSDFGASNNCGAVPVNGSCTVNVSFTPAAGGPRAGTVGFTHNGGGMATVSLSGTGANTPAVGTKYFSPTVITTGANTVFTWSTSDASSATVSCSGAVSGSASGVSGSLTMAGATAGTGTCTVTATNAAGTQVTGAASVSVVSAPSVGSASFSPTSVMAGNASTFSWSTGNATSANVSCSGPVSGSGSGTSGSITVNTTATGTGTCTVTAYNAAGSTASRSANLSVTPPYSYGWASGGWSTPSACGSTTSTRSVWCQRSDGASVSDAYCGGGKPSSSQSATNYSGCSYGFSYGGWSTPNGCGAVTQTRSASCVRSDGTTVSNAYCGTPVTSQSTTNYNSCSYNFSYGAWTNPSGCGTVTQSRGASCIRSDGTAVSNAYCGTPVTSQTTTNYNSCSYSANIGGWGSCSTSCGNGTQSRSVSCTRSDGATVGNSYCGSPATTQGCSANHGCAPVCPSPERYCNWRNDSQNQDPHDTYYEYGEVYYTGPNCTWNISGPYNANSCPPGY